MPAVLFSIYLIYGLIRPWVSQRWRKEIEVDGDEENAPNIELDSKPGEATDQNP